MSSSILLPSVTSPHSPMMTVFARWHKMILKLSMATSLNTSRQSRTTVKKGDRSSLPGYNGVSFVALRLFKSPPTSCRLSTLLPSSLPCPSPLPNVALSPSHPIYLFRHPFVESSSRVLVAHVYFDNTRHRHLANVPPHQSHRPGSSTNPFHPSIYLATFLCLLQGHWTISRRPLHQPKPMSMMAQAPHLTRLLIFQWTPHLMHSSLTVIQSLQTLSLLMMYYYQMSH